MSKEEYWKFSHGKESKSSAETATIRSLGPFVIPQAPTLGSKWVPTIMISDICPKRTVDC